VGHRAQVSLQEAEPMTSFRSLLRSSTAALFLAGCHGTDRSGGPLDDFNADNNGNLSGRLTSLVA
jgi:hypothetical protein